MVTEILTLVNIADVYLNDRTFQRTDAVVKGYASMGIGSCIEDDAVVGEAYLLHLVNQLSLDIALIVFYFPS